MIEVPTFEKDATGAVYLGQSMPWFKGGILIPTVNPTVIGSGAISQPVLLESESDSWAEIYNLYGNATAGAAADIKTLLCIIKDQRFGERQLSNVPVLVEHAFGNQQKPFRLTSDDENANGIGESILLPPYNDFTVQFLNPGAGSVSFSMAATRTKIQNKARNDARLEKQIQATMQRQKQITPYWMSMDQFFVSAGIKTPGVQLTAAQPQQDVFFTNKNNLTFFPTVIMADFVTTQAGGETVEGFTGELFDITSGAPLQTQPVSFNCGFGTGQLPFFLPVPLQIGNKDSLRIRLTNLLTGAGTTTIFVTLFGLAVWNPDGVYINYGASGEEST